MITFNLVTFIGNVGRDPEAQHTPEGKAVTRFSLAVSTYAGKDEQGKVKSEAMWLTVKCWNDLARQTQQVLAKGALVLVSGKLAIRTYTDTHSSEQTAVEVIAQTVELLSVKKPLPDEAGQQAA